MVSFTKFYTKPMLSEKKLAIFTFLRANPPTMQHKRLISQVKYLDEGDQIIFIASGQGKHNPLKLETKIEYMKKLLPEAHYVTVKNPLVAANWLLEKEYSDFIGVTPSNNIHEFDFLKEYIEQRANSFEIVSSGIKDGDNNSSILEAARKGDIGMFRALTGWTGDDAAYLMEDVCKGLGDE